MRNFSLLSLLKEESSCGAGASFSPGEGEQFTSAKAFGKKKKNMIIKKSIKEEVSFSVEKREEFYKKALADYDKAKQDVERYINIFSGFNMGEMMSELDKAEKFVKMGEAIEDKFEKICKRLYDDADAYSEEELDSEYEKTMKLEDKYSKLKTSVYKIYDGMGDIIRLFEKLKDERY